MRISRRRLQQSTSNDAFPQRCCCSAHCIKPLAFDFPCHPANPKAAAQKGTSSSGLSQTASSPPLFRAPFFSLHECMRRSGLQQLPTTCKPFRPPPLTFLPTTLHTLCRGWQQQHPLAQVRSLYLHRAAVPAARNVTTRLAVSPTTGFVGEPSAVKHAINLAVVHETYV